ncbi:hypothetical protein Q3G72_034763 [Acer saccharum]|nr:hypothetical protein Q3G72_014331 [Acer saccharum]KAK1548876.1 hypothetical protein Q3G72_034763 [Acer saccharum]
MDGCDLAMGVGFGVVGFKGLDYELVPVDVAAGEHKQQSYLSLNPFGQIPAFEDGDVKLFESRAISKYLANKHKDIGTDLLRSGSLNESAIVETWMEVETHPFNAPMRTLIHQLILNPLGEISTPWPILYHIPYLFYFMKTPKAIVVTDRPHVLAWWIDISSRPATIEVAQGMTLHKFL